MNQKYIIISRILYQKSFEFEQFEALAVGSSN